MGIKLLTLPAGYGKTTWVVNQVRKASADLSTQPRVVLPSRQQVLDFEARLASAGGAMGVEVGTIIDLAGEVVELGGVYPLLLSENLQLKTLRAVLEDLDLSYYLGIRSKPGFVRSCLRIIRELKAGGITPEEFLNAAKGGLKGSRLTELGLIYSAYQEKLRQNNWADRAGLAWLAVNAARENSTLGRDWGEVYLDGFDDLTPIQYQLVSILADRVEKFYLTITGSLDGNRRELVHKRFTRLREMLQEGEIEDLQVESEREINLHSPAAILERSLFETGDPGVVEIEGKIHLAAVPDREAEVRTALRWIRSRILEEGIPLARTAILARNLEPYRGLISRIAGEYKIPVRLQGGLPLAENPLMAVVLKLAALISQGKEGLVWHDVLSIWRSPYLNWSALTSNPETGYSRSGHLADTKQLEEVVRWGRVIRGYSQWAEAFQSLTAGPDPVPDLEDGQPETSDGLPRGKRAEQLWRKFSWFIDLLQPPMELTSRERFIAWFVSTIGGLDPGDSLQGGLGVVGEILASPDEIASRDWAALAALNRIFKEQIQAECLLDSQPVTFSQFADELGELINQRSYQPREWEEDAVFCAGCTEARGLAFQAAALLGLAEGEFPGTIKEDPFLRDEERSLFRAEFDLPLNLSVDSAEGEYLYEALTRSPRFLLLTRPRIADNGAAWQPSPYWEEVQRITKIDPEVATTRTRIPPNMAANQTELLQAWCLDEKFPTGGDLGSQQDQLDRVEKLERFREITEQRASPLQIGLGSYDGDLQDRAETIAGRYGAEHIWSASRLETYQTCPFNYFISYLLGLEKPELPEEGLDARQLGNIYHHILESLYRQVGEDYTVDDLLEHLPESAASEFRDAPEREGFRETAWWEHTQREIVENLRLTLVRLEEIEPGFRFYGAEKRFGISPGEDEPLSIEVQGQGRYLLRGFIDRVDRNEKGEIRIVDYKAGGRSGFDNRAVREGKKLQIPLYALAAQQGLKLGKVKEGFYFHLLAAEPSSFKLSSFQDRSARGPEAAMARAAEKGWQAVSSIKGGHFSPRPPDQGCPEYCPAVDFCWHYRPRRW